jgi:hypothetical protein
MTIVATNKVFNTTQEKKLTATVEQSLRIKQYQETNAGYMPEQAKATLREAFPHGHALRLRGARHDPFSAAGSPPSHPAP